MTYALFEVDARPMEMEIGAGTQNQLDAGVCI